MINVWYRYWLSIPMAWLQAPVDFYEALGPVQFYYFHPNPVVSLLPNYTHCFWLDTIMFWICSESPMTDLISEFLLDAVCWFGIFLFYLGYTLFRGQSLCMLSRLHPISFSAVKKEKSPIKVMLGIMGSAFTKATWDVGYSEGDWVKLSKKIGLKIVFKTTKKYILKENTCSSLFPSFYLSPYLLE